MQSKFLFVFICGRICLGCLAAFREWHLLIRRKRAIYVKREGTEKGKELLSFQIHFTLQRSTSFRPDDAMATKRKAILSAGFGRFATLSPSAQQQFGPDAGTKAKELLATSVKKAEDAGFDLVTVDMNRRSSFYVNPLKMSSDSHIAQDFEDSLHRFTETLKSRQFDGVNIGYGVRGHKGGHCNLSIMISRLVD